MSNSHFTTADRLPSHYNSDIENWLFERFWLEFYGIDTKDGEIEK